MAYNKVQFIAHNIFTGPKYNATTQEYVGIANAAEDISERVALVGSAINTAYNHGNTDQTATTLKIFMLPEFFFRGKTGAYSMDDVQKVVTALQTLVKDAKWEHWLFVFGTIVGQSQQVQAKTFWTSMMHVLFGASKTPIDQSKPIEGYNYSLIQKGGFGDIAKAPDYAHAVLKEHKSGIDFITKAKLSGGGVTLERVTHLEPSNKTTSEQQTHSYDGLSVFTVDGHTFGLEVCLDHAMKRLKSSNLKTAIDIQVVPSCGMTIQADAVVARKGGYVFNGDGLKATLDDMSDAQKVDASTGAHTKIARAAKVAVVYAKHADIFPYGPGQLSIYPAEPL